MYWYFDDIVLQDTLSRFTAPMPFVRHMDFGSLDVRSGVKSIRPWASQVNTELANLCKLKQPMRDGVALVMSPPQFGQVNVPLTTDDDLFSTLSKDYRCGMRLEVALDLSSNWTIRRVDTGDDHFMAEVVNSKPIPPGGSLNHSLRLEKFHYHFSPPGVIPPGFEEIAKRCVRSQIHEFTQFLAGAQLVRGAVLSEREGDLQLIAKLAATSATDDAMRRNSMSYEVSLPYVSGLSPAQLFELRHELPDAFESFRAQLTLYCIDSRNLQHSISRAEELSKLEKELAASLRAKFMQNRILGYGSGLVAASSIMLGALGMTFLGPMLPIFGAGGLLASAAQSEHTRRSLMASPACFIWKAKRMSTK